MSGNPRENAKNKGFWDGGSAGQGTERESGGRRSAFPGMRRPTQTGVRTDLNAPIREQLEETADDNTID